MHGVAIALVLLSAIFHATWNAQLKGVDARSRFMVSMCLAVGFLSLLCVPFVPWPSMSSWRCIAASAVLHIIYNLLLLENYKRSDLSSAYAIARGISPSLVTLGAFLLMRQRPSALAVAGVIMVSVGIVFCRPAKRRATNMQLFLLSQRVSSSPRTQWSMAWEYNDRKARFRIRFGFSRATCSCLLCSCCCCCC
jgi:multidrug transporter EmrE-like cation transporter